MEPEYRYASLFPYLFVAFADFHESTPPSIHFMAWSPCCTTLHVHDVQWLIIFSFEIGGVLRQDVFVQVPIREVGNLRGDCFEFRDIRTCRYTHPHQIEKLYRCIVVVDFDILRYTYLRKSARKRYH